MSHPLRIQRKRTKGYRMPEGAVYVGRPTKFGNPYPSAWDFRCTLRAILDGQPLTNERAKHREHMERIAADLGELQGKPLACWCALNHSCHADVLAEYANR